MPSASNYILYEKPDNESNIILQDNSSIEVKILDETKYYYKVEFTKMIKAIQVLSKKTMFQNDISERNHFNFTCNYFTNNCNIELEVC